MKKYFGLLLFILCFKNLAAQDYLIPYRKGTLWGYANEEGKIIIEPKYSAVELFANSELAKIYSFKNDTIYIGFASLNGNITIAPNKYVNVGTLKDASNRSSYDADYVGQYDAYDKFLDKYYLAANNSTNNELLDSTAKVLLQNFDRLEIINKYQEGNFNILFRKDNKYGVMDYRGKMLLEPIYDYMYIDLVDKYNPLLTIKNKGKIGIYSKDGKPIIPLALQYIYLDRYRNLYQKVILVNKNNFNSVYNTSGKLLFGPSKKEILIESKIEDGVEKLVFSLNKESLENANTRKNEIREIAEIRAVPPPAREAEPDRTEPKDGGSYIYSNSGYPVININGKDYTFFKQNNLMGIRDAKDTNIVYVQPMYDNLDTEMDINTYKKINIIKVRKDKSFGLIDYEGKILVPIKYKSLFEIHGKFNIAEPILFIAGNEKNKVGLIDAKNKTIIPFNYVEIYKSQYHMNDSIFYVKNLNGKKGYVKINIDNAIPDEYTELLHIDFGYGTDGKRNDGYFLAKNAVGKYGIIDLYNKTVLDFIYDSIVNPNLFTDVRNTKDLAYYHFVNYKNGEYAMFDGKGNTIIPYTKEKIVFLLNDKINEKEYYYVTTKTDKNYIVYSALYSTKKGLLYDYTKNDFYNYRNNNNYTKGIIYFKDTNNLIGVVINNGNKKIIEPKYNSVEKDYRINNSTLRKNKLIEYYSLQYQNGQYTFYDFIDSNGVMFFEN